jgi:hypothetical protein
MIITKDAWVEISDGGCVVVKQSTDIVDICFSANEPLNKDEAFGLKSNKPITLPNLNGKVWAKARSGDVKIVVGTFSAF